MKKTIFITFFPAYPHRSGAASVSYNIFKYTSGQRWLLQLSDENKIDKLNDDMTVISVEDNSKTRYQKISGLFNRIEKIADKVKQIDPDTIYFEGASWVLYFVLLYRKLQKIDIKSKIIYHSHNVEYILRKQKHGPVITAITKWSEKYLLTHCDYFTAVSEIDAQQFNDLYGVKPIILPNGVDINNFDSVTDEEVQNIKVRYNLHGKIVLFMGLIGYGPNDEAVDFLIKKVFPGLIKKVPDSKLVIIGGVVNNRYSWLINPGNIPPEELPAFIKACDICVSPIFSGSGTRVKILEYLAANKPVISTTKGAEGLDLVDKKHVVLVNDSDAFVYQLSKYLTDDQALEKLIKQSKGAVKKYDWISVMEGFQKELHCYKLRCNNKKAR